MMTRRYLLGVALIAATLCVVVPTAVRTSRSPAIAARLKAEQQAMRIVDRAATLARRIAPDAGAITMEVERSDNRVQHDVLYVVCRHQDGSEFVRATWRAATGELLTVSRLAAMSAARPVVTDRSSAAATAWGWVRALDMSEADGSWWTERTVHQTARVWACTFRSGHRRVYVQITSAGDLAMAVASIVQVPAGSPATLQSRAPLAGCAQIACCHRGRRPGSTTRYSDRRSRGMARVRCASGTGRDSQG